MTFDFKALRALQNDFDNLPGISTPDGQNPVPVKPCDTKNEIMDALTAGKIPDEILQICFRCVGELSQDPGFYDRCKEIFENVEIHGRRARLQKVREKIDLLTESLLSSPIGDKQEQRLLRIYSGWAEDLERVLDDDGDWKGWDYLPTGQKEKIYSKLEKDPDTLEGVIKRLPFDLERIDHAGQVLRYIREQLQRIDRRKGFRKTWKRTSPEDLLNLLERKSAQLGKEPRPGSRGV